MATKPKDIIARIKENDIEWVDLRFTDPKGKWQHLTMVASILGEDELEVGLMFDRSSIEGWKAINESDMILKPDLDAVYDDPFSATPMLVIFCDIVEPKISPEPRDSPIGTALDWCKMAGHRTDSTANRASAADPARCARGGGQPKGGREA